jgi:hypothetical protein
LNELETEGRPMQTMARGSTSRVRLVERAAGIDRVDEGAGIVRGVRVLGGSSLNGRTYPRTTMQRALGLYEGCKVFLDHERRVGDRSVTTMVGRLQNVRLVADAIVADLHLVRSHPHAGWILERARVDPGSFGLSHNARGDLDERTGEVSRILAVDSVDIVDSPATNKGLFESVEDAGGYEAARRHHSRGWDPGPADWRERMRG